MEDSAKERFVCITTIDNPYDPIDDFDHWNQFDLEKGYFTNSKLARLIHLSDDMSSAEEALEIERGIDRLIEIDPLDIYKKIVREEDKDTRGEV